MTEREMFFSFAHAPIHQATQYGFGHLAVSVDFPIRNEEDLNRAFMKGLREIGLQGKQVVILSWRFFED